MICAYCDKAGKATREHVIPNWYSQTPGDSDVFSARAPLSHVKGDLVVKDVCSPCNNGPLASLDGYGKYLYKTYFAEPVYSEEMVTFEYDGNRLLRWLLKLSYNSARAQNTDVRLLHNYRKVILGVSPVPDVKCWLYLITPSLVIDETKSHIGPAHRRDRDSNNLDKPLWFRIGHFRLPSHPALFLVQRTVIINSFAFVFIMPNAATSRCNTDVEDWSGAFIETYPRAQPLSRELDRLVVRAGPEHTSLHRHGMMVSYPSRYSENENRITSWMLKSRADEVSVVALEVDSSWVLACDTEVVAAALRQMVSNREEATAYKLRVTLVVNGFSNDPRDLWEIPEAKAFFRKLFLECPFIMFLAHRGGCLLKLMAACWAYEDAAFRPSLFSEFLMKGYIGLNELNHTIALSPEENERIGRDAAAVLFGEQLS